MTNTTDISRSLRLLARLLAYPDAAFRRDLPQVLAALESDRAILRKRRGELRRWIDKMRDVDAFETESAYVELFDRGRATSLHLFEHVHGDSRERGSAMVDLVKAYEAAGLYLAPGELPDYLPAFLEYASTQPARQARAMLGEIAHVLNRIFSALTGRRSGYASVLGALLEIAGEKAHAVTLPPEESVDETWAEPPVFAGCASPGQSRPNAPQPIRFVREGGAA